MKAFDLSALGFEDFIDLVFGSYGTDPSTWKNQRQCFIATDPLGAIDRLTQLFHSFPSVAKAYSLPQLNNGIWALLGSGEIEPSLVESLVSPDNEHPKPSLNKRIRCIQSMYRVYADFVSRCEVETLENCFFMWWEFICFEFWSIAERNHDDTKNIPYEDLNELERAIIDCIFETLNKILELDDMRTKICALHGLGHSRHPSRANVVQHFLDVNLAELPPEEVKWIEQCRDGTVM